jgi:gamma-glutamyltranspeptidase/glutathione hydrolase
MADWYKASLGDIPVDEVHKAKKDEIRFCSRRSPVLCRHACVATSQPLATSIGVDFLRRHANAADTAVAVAAALAVTEPCSTGLGGDMFCLYFDAATKEVMCVNGSGASPADLSLDLLKKTYPDGLGGVNEAMFRDSPHAVTVPGAARGWEDLLSKHGSGKFTLAQLLEPSAVLAEEGFPVGPVTSYHWKAGIPQIRKWLLENESVPLTINGRDGPEPGDLIYNPDLARVLRNLGKQGSSLGFYRGNPGQAIVDIIQKHGGTMTLQDLAMHKSDFPEALSVEYRGCKLWQHPPNGQGVAGQIALAGVDCLEQTRKCPTITPETIGNADSYHVMMEMMRLGFADARAYVADPASMKVDNKFLLNTDRIGLRAEQLFNPEKAAIAGLPDASNCTVSFQVVDEAGNAISLVNSNFMGFGTGLVPEGCGFTLQNRGFGFNLQEGHPNQVGASKRPYHTIIPGVLTHSDTSELYATISNMGGNMQPQGHMQLTIDMLAGGMDPQQAIDMPRFCIADGTQAGVVFMEEGVKEEVLYELKRRGHIIQSNQSGHERSTFGRAQIIKRDRATGVLWAGSDGRADGCAMGF